jgi:hypothetical protein
VCEIESKSSWRNQGVEIKLGAFKSVKKQAVEIKPLQSNQGGAIKAVQPRRCNKAGGCNQAR